MQTPSVSRHLRRIIVRGLAPGLLILQSAVMVFAQNVTPPSSAADYRKTEGRSSDQVVVLDPIQVEAGFTGSLAAAAATKENASTIVEVIAPEDIGKLPDIS